MKPRLIIHGGLGSRPKPPEKQKQVRQSLYRIAEDAFAFLQYHSAVETAVYAASLLEDDPLFNAGTGSKIQSDGVIRMTASIMDGAKERFAGVINIREVKNPVQVAARLLEYNDRVLASEEAIRFARAQGFEHYNPETPARRQEYEQQDKGKSGTIGCVALDGQGRLAAATSTGGKGFEIPGRVSDSATVAGNYANAFAAVSCTGTGEEIVDKAFAARVVMRVTDGMSLAAACEKSIAEAKATGAHIGMIALDAGGQIYHAAAQPYMTYATGEIDLFI
jgi:L-asparaginase